MSSVSLNGPLEVVFSFDTTGSMYACLEQLRGRLQDMIQRLQSDIPGIRMAICAHGDYCDASVYVTKWIDFTTDVAELCKFVQSVEQTCGGDSPECYELVLNQTRTRLSWTHGSRRALVLIGDDVPHESTFPQNTDDIDWKLETRELAMGGVSIYGVQCGNNTWADYFYKTISFSTGGKHLRLEDFGNLFDVLMAVCYREGNNTAMLASYEKEVRARNGGAGIARDIDAVFASLRDNTGDGSAPLVMKTLTSRKILKARRTKYTQHSQAMDKKEVKARDSGARISIDYINAVFASPCDSIKDAPAPLVSPPESLNSFIGKPEDSVTDPGIMSFKTSMKRPLIKVLTSRKVLTEFRAKYARRNKASGLSQFREENIPLLKRENVPEKNFGLNTLRWSSWILVLSPERPEKHEEMWVKRRGLVGYRLNIVKPAGKIANNQQKVIFEVSVKTPCSGKQRHVVFSSFSTRCLNNTSWERCLISVRSQLERVLRDGCYVYLRYSIVGKRTAPSSLKYGLKRYDYAWKKLRQIRDHPRVVTKGSYCISMDEC